MNWTAMLLMASFLGVSSLIVWFVVWLVDDRHVNPIWFVGALFLVAILAVGVTAK